MPDEDPGWDQTNDDVEELLSRKGLLNRELIERLVALMYPDLKRIAEAHMRRDRRNHTLQATALVNEFFLKLARRRDVQWESRSHFLFTASRVMRHLLIDYARHHNRHDGKFPRVGLDEVDVPQSDPGFSIAEINELLEKLSKEHPRRGIVIELKVFGGLTIAEIAEVLHVGERTIKRDLQLAKDLLCELVRGRKEDGCGATRSS